jgi:hypothetical protein
LINVLGGFSSLGYTVFGYNDGAGMPDATTQADIDALIALGIPEARIAWVDLGTLNAFTIGGASSASSIENLVLALSSGVFAIDAAASASAIENIILASASGGVFTIQDSGSASAIDLVVISQASGTFVVADISSLSDTENVTITSVGQFIVAAVASASAIENVVMVQHGGTFAVANSASASGLDNVIITEDTVSPFSMGWTLLTSGNSVLTGAANSITATGASAVTDGSLAVLSDAAYDVDFTTPQVFTIVMKATGGYAASEQSKYQFAINMQQRSTYQSAIESNATYNPYTLVSIGHAFDDTLDVSKLGINVLNTIGDPNFYGTYDNGEEVVTDWGAPTPDEFQVTAALNANFTVEIHHDTVNLWIVLKNTGGTTICTTTNYTIADLLVLSGAKYLTIGDPFNNYYGANFVISSVVVTQ